MFTHHFGNKTVNCSWVLAGRSAHTVFWGPKTHKLLKLWVWSFENGTLRWKLWRQGPASLIWGTIYSQAWSAGQQETWSTTELCLYRWLIWVYGLAESSQVFKSQSYQALRSYPFSCFCKFVCTWTVFKSLSYVLFCFQQTCYHVFVA